MRMEFLEKQLCVTGIYTRTHGKYMLSTHKFSCIGNTDISFKKKKKEFISKHQKSNNLKGKLACVRSVIQQKQKKNSKSQSNIH